jgi:hypothetical protein
MRQLRGAAQHIGDVQGVILRVVRRARGVAERVGDRDDQKPFVEDVPGDGTLSVGERGGAVASLRTGSP